jgi:Flp pilus assembly protein TadD/predicted SAM-dependent methyltransferase/glycosyltransferase involved in cell wall biosynthesis
MRSIYLNVGCGAKPISGFVNIDLGPGGDIRLDVRAGLPFPSDSVAGIVCEHFIEQLTQAEGINFLRECRRVLADGACLRLTTPDLDELVRRYNSSDGLSAEELAPGYDWLNSRCEMLNLAFREWAPRWLYNEEALNRMAHAAGLTVSRRRAKGESSDPRLRGRDSHTAEDMALEYVKTLPATDEASPLVSILIPAYRARFFRAALESALQQTYLHTEIIVGDDSPTGEIGAIVAEYKGRHVALRCISGHVGPVDNHLRCLAEARGEYIKYLNDDDLLHPDCVRRLADCLRQYPSVTLVTSHRQCIDEQGQPLPDITATHRPVFQDSWIEGVSAINVMLSLDVNYLGEPTTVMFRRRDAQSFKPSMYHLLGRRNRPGDQRIWTNLLGRGDLIYLVDTLAYFRLHSNQQQRSPEYRAEIAEGMKQLRFDAARLGFLQPPEPYRLRARPLRLQPGMADTQAKEGASISALERARRALHEVPDDVSLVVDYGYQLLQAGQLDAARRAFVKATVFGPQYSPAYRHLAAVLVGLGRNPEAETAVRRALELNPNDGEAKALLASLTASLHLPAGYQNVIGDGEYLAVGQEFLGHFTNLGGLRPTDKVLDVGCGFGRMAHALTHYLAPTGSYDGIEIVAGEVDWCRKNITSRYPNFAFHHADIANRHYNPTGKTPATAYRFPFADDTFDFILLTSVFTHMLPADVTNYFKEIQRVLKPNGRGLITFFLYPEAEGALDFEATRLRFSFVYSNFRIKSQDDPEAAVAYVEPFILDLFGEFGLEVDLPIYHGKWSGNKAGSSYQDIVVFHKKEKAALPAAPSLVAATPSTVLAYLRQAKMQLEAGDGAGACQALEQALSLMPDEPELIVIYGNILAQTGSLEMARAQYVKASVLAPGYAPAHKNLALTLARMGKTAEAEAAVRRALALTPEDSEAQAVLAALTQG